MSVSTLTRTVGFYARCGFILFSAILSVPALASEPARLADKALLLSATKAGNVLIAAGERGFILRSVDGRIWEQAPTPTEATLTDVTFIDANTGWAVGHNATILHSVNGGRSWTQQYDTTRLEPDDAARDAPLLTISCLNAKTCAAAGAYGLLLVTTDGGEHWERRYVKESDRNFYALHMFDATHWLIAGESGGLLTTDTAGDDWIALMPPYDGSFFGFLLAPDKSWVLYGLRGHVLRSTDNGQSWSIIDTGMQNSLMGGRALPDGRIALAGASGTVLLSSDNGQSFTLHRQSKRQALADIIENADGQLILLGEKGAQPLEQPHE